MAKGQDIDAVVDDVYGRLKCHAAANPDWPVNVFELPGMSGRERAAVALAAAVGQIGNGGLFQYVDNGVAHRAPAGGVPACVAAGALVAGGRAHDPEVADALSLLLRGAASARHREDFARLRLVIERNALDAVTREMYALGHGRIDAFLTAVMAGHPDDLDPFATEWRPEPLPPFVPGQDVRHPSVVVDATGLDGNAHAIVAEVAGALRRGRIPAEEIQAFRDEALSGGYDKVLSTMMRWVSVEFSPEEDADAGMDDGEGADGPSPGFR